ncbi:MAG TPA: helix-turn-helix transcriptional regulator, partial [Candidatus Dormibacteraeota bacterium]
MPDGDHTQTARNERLVHARTSLHWSQAETARRLGVATTTYARWERGEQRPHPGQVRRLEVIFDRPAEDLGFGHASLAEPELAAASAVAAPVEQQFDRLIDQVRDRWARLLQR